jgi:uncharacterized membrane protein
MEWFVFTLISMLVLSMVSIIAKIILTKKTKDFISYNLTSFIFDAAAIVLLPAFLALKFDFSSVLAAISGFAFAFLWIIFFRSVRNEEVSRVAMIRGSAPIIVLFLSLIFLKESLDINKYLGIVMLVSSTFLASYKKSGKKFRLSGELATLLLFVFGTACVSVLTKYTLNFTDYWNFFFWSIVGGEIGRLMLLSHPRIRKNFMKMSLSIGRNAWIAIAVAYVLNFVGLLSYYIAVSLGKISIVYSFNSANPLILFVYTLILTNFMPHTLKEDVSRTSLIMKSLAGALIVVGSYLIII